MEYLFQLVLIIIVCNHLCTHVNLQTNENLKIHLRASPFSHHTKHLGNLPQNTNRVISSPHGAKEVLQKHDQIFSNKTIPDTGL